MSSLPRSVVEFLASGPLAHVVTLGHDGDPHVSVAWVGIEDDEVVIGTAVRPAEAAQPASRPPDRTVVPGARAHRHRA